MLCCNAIAMVAFSWFQLRRRRRADRDAAVAAARANQSAKKEKKQALPLEELDCNARSIAYTEWLEKRQIHVRVDALSAESSDSELGEERTDVGATHDCVVCLTPMDGDDVLRETSCSHIFHALCLERWWRRRHHDCPLCRYDLRSEKLKLESREKQCVEEPVMYMIF